MTARFYRLILLPQQTVGYRPGIDRRYKTSMIGWHHRTEFLPVRTTFQAFRLPHFWNNESRQLYVA
jgi:hypothetical protein